jgi:hypothetical protein
LPGDFGYISIDPKKINELLLRLQIGAFWVYEMNVYKSVHWERYSLKSIIFWDMTPCSLLSCNRRFCLPPACLLVLAEIISSTLEMEAICSSETSVATQRTTRRHVPEDDTLHNHRCGNLKSCIRYSQFSVYTQITEVSYYSK